MSIKSANLSERDLAELNISEEQALSNIRYACEHYKTDLKALPRHDALASIICPGASLKKTWPLIEGDIFALNNAHDFLIGIGIIPDYAVVCDGQPGVSQFYQNPHKDVTYLIASQCDPSVFQALEGYNVVLWHSAGVDGMEDIIGEERLSSTGIGALGCGLYLGIRAQSLVYMRGYRRTEYHGFDSCILDSKHHVAPQRLNANDEEELEIVDIEGKRFLTSGWMRDQSDQFMQFRYNFFQDCDIRVHGDGLIAERLRFTEEGLRNAAARRLS